MVLAALGHAAQPLAGKILDLDRTRRQFVEPDDLMRVDRLQRDDLVLRQPDPDDARGMYTVLTPKGRDVLRDASSVHLARVSQLVLDRLTDTELRQLQALMIKLDPAAPEPQAAAEVE